MEPAFSAPDLNRAVSERRFPYRRCAGCGLLALFEPPDDLASYYGDEYHQIPTAEHVRRSAAYDRSKIELVRRFVPGGRLLEIGPSYGVFAAQAQEAGFEVAVIEMDERCCRFLADELWLRVVRSARPEDELPKLAPQRATALWQTLEHLPDPWRCLEEAAKALAPGGALFVSTPNPRALQFRLFGRAWNHVDAPRHLWLVPEPALTRKLEGLGLRAAHRTADDREARGWNYWGWRNSLMNLLPPDRRGGRLTNLAATAAGLAAAALLSPVERTGFRGASYTAAYVKPEGGAP